MIINADHSANQAYLLSAHVGDVVENKTTLSHAEMWRFYNHHKTLKNKVQITLVPRSVYDEALKLEELAKIATTKSITNLN